MLKIPNETFLWITQYLRRTYNLSSHVPQRWSLIFKEILSSVARNCMKSTRIALRNSPFRWLICSHCAMICSTSLPMLTLQARSPARICKLAAQFSFLGKRHIIFRCILAPHTVGMSVCWSVRRSVHRSILVHRHVRHTRVDIAKLGHFKHGNGKKKYIPRKYD